MVSPPDLAQTQALTDFRTAANLAPGLAGYRLREATLLFQLGEPESARTMMQVLLRVLPCWALLAE